MIRIIRPSVPEFHNSTRLNSVLDEVLRMGNSNEGRRIPFYEDLISPLRKDISAVFHDKCAFCESIAHFPVSGNIDHFRPKSGCRTGNGKDSKFLPLHYSWLAYEWNNLYLVCNVCNKYRRDYFPLSDESTRAEFFGDQLAIDNEKTLLIDPCKDEPFDHIHFDASGRAIGITAKGITTIELFGLNRGELVEARFRAISSFEHFYDNSRKNEITDEMDLYVEALFSDHPLIQFAGTLRSVAGIVVPDYVSPSKRFPTKYRSKSQENDVKSSEIAFNEKSVLGEFMIANETAQVVFDIDTIKNFSIKSVEIVNFKSVKKLELSIDSSVTNISSEPWLLLLGDNGIGKSSILQAIALALIGQKEINRLNLAPSTYLRNRTKRGYVKIVSYESDVPITLTITKGGITSSVSESPTYILGYGSTRLLPKGNLRSRNGSRSIVNVSNLFDYSVALIDVNKWLADLTKTKSGIDLLHTRILPALLDLLDIEDNYVLSFTKKGLQFKSDSERHLIDGISDGFKSVLGLAVDIMKSLSNDIAGYHSTQGIVLVDELGNHLHPRWRMKIVSSLRRAFPNLQFIVSTHEPLCLRGLAHGEVVVLLMKDKRLVIMDKTELPDHNLLRVDQLLTSDLFGLINTFDLATEKKYAEYYRLLSIPEEQRTLLEQEQITEYTLVLSNKELIGNSPQDQVLFQVVNETWANKILEEGYKTVAELKAETVEDVRGILKNKNLDWL